jgi:hypothetical protein
MTRTPAFRSATAGFFLATAVIVMLHLLLA